MFMGYYKDPELTRQAWHDGLYRTGDVAWRDEEGYFWYVGRADDVIKSSGYRIGPFEVESADGASRRAGNGHHGRAASCPRAGHQGNHRSGPRLYGQRGLKKRTAGSCQTHDGSYKYPGWWNLSMSCPRPSAERSAGWSCGIRSRNKEGL